MERRLAFFLSSWARKKRERERKGERKERGENGKIGKTGRNTVMKELFIKDLRVSHGTLALQGAESLCKVYAFALHDKAGYGKSRNYPIVRIQPDEKYV